MVAAALCVFEAPRNEIHNETFDVGQTDENYRISELAAIVAETVPGSCIEYASGGGPDKRCDRVSCEKIRSLPAFGRSGQHAMQGRARAYDAYRAIGLTSEVFNGGQYFRIVHLRRLL